MPDCSAGVSQQSAEINALNFKLLYDDTSSDISINRKSLMRHQDAWETLRLRNAQFAASFDHALLTGVAIQSQTGNAADQQTVSPIRTAAGDSTVQMPPGAAYPANRSMDSGLADATNATGVATSDIVASIAKLTDAINALLLRSAGTGAAAAGNPQPGA